MAIKICRDCGIQYPIAVHGSNRCAPCRQAKWAIDKARRTIVKRPAAVQGTAGIAKTKKATNVGVMQTSDSQYNVQGSGAKPYIVDLEGHDPDLSGTTHTCTCVNWKITRNSLKQSNGSFTGYDCKHILQVLAAKGVPKTTGVTAQRAQELRSEIMDTFVKKAK